MPEKRSSVLWRKATPLNRAWLELASDEVRKAFHELPTAADAMRAMGSEQPTGGFLERALNVASTWGHAEYSKRAMEAKLKSTLADRINDGEFELLGYRAEPIRSRGPVSIPNPDLKKYPPDWKEESLQIRDELYFELRLSPSQARAGVSKRRGRPGSNGKILEIVEQLIAEPDTQFCNLPRKPACDLVRSALNKIGIPTTQNGSGFSDNNIEKIILKRCPPRYSE